MSTGKADFLVDFIASKEADKLVDLSGYVGYRYGGNPDGFDIPTGAFQRPHVAIDPRIKQERSEQLETISDTHAERTSEVGNVGVALDDCLSATGLIGLRRTTRTAV